MNKLSRRSLLKTAVPGAVLGLTLGAHIEAQQPHMRAALQALRNAQRDLEKATPDKGGHRAKALELVRDAIDEVEKGIAYDRRR
jgi:hypothetical protein